MRYWGQLKGLVFVLAVGGIFALIGMIIGSNLSIPEKLKAEPQGETGRVIDAIPSNGHSPFVKIAERVKPAVVNISAESVTEDKFHNFMDDDFFRRFFGVPPDGRSPNAPRTRRSESLGSGFIFSPDGYILTNNHVVENAERVTVTLSTDQKFKAEVIGADSETDVAVLKINADYELPFIELGNSDSILVGDWVMAIGNPFPHLGLDRTVTVGVVSAKERQNLAFGGESPSYQNYIQTDASINPGNSGGPLVNLSGQAIGVNSAIATPTGGNVGIGFAIPIEMAKDVADQLMKSGKVARGYLGIYPQNITQDLKEANGLPTTEGVLVAQVDKDTPADKSNLKVGDVITKFNGKPVSDAQQFRFLVAAAGPGADAKLEVWRNGDTKMVIIKLGDRTQYVAETRETPTEEKREQSWLGLTVETMTEGIADQYGLEPSDGAVVVDIEPSSPADDGGIMVGDIIQKVGNKPVKDSVSFYKIADEQKKSSKPISFYIKRGQSNIFVAITPNGD
jgi:serine protease Do